MGEPQRLFPDQPDYAQDLCAWALANAALLRAGRVAEIDAQHIAEELEDMGRSERRALRSHLHILLLHLLKWQFQPSHREVSWKLSIRNARHRIGIVLDDSPSLRPLVPELIAAEYPLARLDAGDETGLPASTLPAVCPYGVEQMMEQDFYPEAP